LGGVRGGNGGAAGGGGASKSSTTDRIFVTVPFWEKRAVARSGSASNFETRSSPFVRFWNLTTVSTMTDPEDKVTTTLEGSTSKYAEALLRRLLTS
jgi:hypothetical protein